MKKKFIIWINRLFQKDKISLDERAEYLFKAYQKITEECSPISRAKVFDLFKQLVIEDFQKEEEIYRGLSALNINHANKCEKALQKSFNIGKTQIDQCQQTYTQRFVDDIHNFEQKI